MPSSAISFKSTDFEKAGKALEKGKFGATVGKPLNTAIRKSANVVRNTARREAAPHRRTGHMRGKIRVVVKGHGLDTVGKVLTGRGTNLIVGGVKPHPITAKDTTPMPLWGGRGKGAGIEGFAMAVQHPGFAADPFFARAIDRARPEVNGILDTAGQNLVSALAESMR